MIGPEGTGDPWLTHQSTCVMNCTDKFLKHSERVGARFAEHNAGESSSSIPDLRDDSRIG